MKGVCAVDNKNYILTTSDNLYYRFDSNTELNLDAAFKKDQNAYEHDEENRERKHFESLKKYNKVELLTSNELIINGQFNVDLLKISKGYNCDSAGQVMINDSLYAKYLLIGEVSVVGSFISQVVEINQNANLDINLDVKDRFINTYLVYDIKSKNIKGKINMSNDFYGQMPELNKKYLLDENNECPLELYVNGKPIKKYNIHNDNFVKNREQYRNLCISLLDKDWPSYIRIDKEKARNNCYGGWFKERQCVPIDFWEVQDG